MHDTRAIRLTEERNLLVYVTEESEPQHFRAAASFILVHFFFDGGKSIKPFQMLVLELILVL
jgi:hypothetical protein